MKDIENSCKIALVQAEPVMFDKSASLKKVLQWIAEAAAQKPDLIVFPELFIPGYPVGMNFGFCIGKRSEDGRKDWKRYYDASVVAGETEFQQLANSQHCSDHQSPVRCFPHTLPSKFFQKIPAQQIEYKSKRLQNSVFHNWVLQIMHAVCHRR